MENFNEKTIQVAPENSSYKESHGTGVISSLIFLILSIMLMAIISAHI